VQATPDHFTLIAFSASVILIDRGTNCKNHLFRLESAMPEKIRFTPQLIDSHCLIDVRTPLEFEEDHIPGAINVPLLTNEERVEIGIMHKNVGPVQARKRGLEMTCPRFYDMVSRIISVADGRPVVVYCWRGGMRSNSVAMLLEICGTPAMQLVGGYKSYRKHVMDFFEKCDFAGPLIVIHGMTGTGKTEFIKQLDTSKWSPIDLEGLACHRGSAFGSLGMQQDFSQKWFESLLWDAFRRMPSDRPIVLEGESRRIGRYFLPGNLYSRMSEGCRAWAYASLETRVKRLTAEYAKPEYKTGMLLALERIRKKLGGIHHMQLQELIETWDVEGIAQGLIESYYDKTYYSTRDWTAEIDLELEDYVRAEAELLYFWNSRNADTRQDLQAAGTL